MPETPKPEVAVAQIARRPLYWRIGVPALLGAIAGLGQAPVSWPFVAVIALLFLLWLHNRAADVRQAALVGWAAGTGYFAATLFWIVEPFLVDIARHGWMAPFALLFMAAGLALFWGAAGGLAKWLAPHRFSGLAWASALAGAELLRSYVLTGFPWSLIGYIWSDSPVMQWAAFFGPHGVTLATLLFVAGTVAAYSAKNNRAVWLGVAAVSLAGFYGAGVMRLAGGADAVANTGPMLRLVQPNAKQHLKWRADMAALFFDRQLSMTMEPADAPLDLVIWPETAVPYLLNHADEPLRFIAQAAGGVPVVLGIQRVEGSRGYNSMIAIGSDGVPTALYDKSHLVPFGEYIPTGDFLAKFGFAAFAAQNGFGYSAGPGPRLLALEGIGKALPLICYEAIFPQDMRTAERPDWLLQITNDAWFGKLSGPYQHLAQARVRTIEQGLPMARAANTGVSAIIDAYGRVISSIPLGVHGYLDGRLPPALAATPYSRGGDLPILLVLCAVALSLWVIRSRQSV